MSFGRSGGLGPRLRCCGCVAAVAVATALAGCAAQKSGAHHVSSIGVHPKSAELPTRRLPDDAGEPWSPGYGTRPRLEDTVPSRAPAPIEGGATRIATMDADAVIRHAVAQHDMRRP